MFIPKLEREYSVRVHDALDSVVSDPVAGILDFAREILPRSIRYSEREIIDYLIDSYSRNKSMTDFSGLGEGDCIQAACYDTLIYLALNSQILTQMSEGETYYAGSD